MVDDISKLYAKILEEQNEKDSKASIVENHLIEENESQISDSFPKEEPFDNFLLKLSEKIAEHLDISEEAEDNQNEEVENNYGGVPLEKQTTKSSYIEELKKIDKGDKSKLLNKNDNISATISEQVKEEIGKVKTQISRMAIEGGGGSVAVQYANGGTMNGDLNVTGKYLSAGIDLSTLIGSGGSGGGLSGTTDRLVSGTEVFKLNTDGTFNFPNNIITPQDEVILTLEATKVLDGYYNRLALSPHGFFASDHNGNSITIDSTDNEILIDSNNTYFWKFNNQGALEGPFGTLSVSGNLSATGRVYQNGNDLQTEIENISSFATSTKTTIQSNSASWNYQGSDIKTLTAGWVGGNSAYTNLVSNSAAYLSGLDLSFLSVSGNWNSTYTTVQANSASWAIDSTTDTEVRSLTSSWDSTYTTVQSYSSSWGMGGGGGGSDVSGLSANWQSTYTTVYSNSANWQGLYTTVQTNSSTWVNGISAQVILARVFNADSVTMNKGDVVYTFGATGDVMSVKLASNVSEATSSKTLGFVNETISTGGIGYVVIAGQIDKMSFPNPFQEGDALWLGETAGTFTRVKPTAPNHLVYLGVVERANNGNGLAYVKVQNGYELDELHDVQITSVSAGDVLQRNATNTLWVNTPLSADKWNSVYSSVQTNSATWNAGSVGPYQATYYKSANQNLTNGSTDITFDLDAAWNNDNGYITHTSGSSNFTVVQAGVYQLEWNTSINANGASWNNSLNKTISINITRSPELEQLVIGQSALMAIGQNYSQSICSTIKLEVGDVINLQTFLAFSIATPFVQGVLNTYDLNTWFYWRFISQ